MLESDTIQGDTSKPISRGRSASRNSNDFHLQNFTVEQLLKEVCLFVSECVILSLMLRIFTIVNKWSYFYCKQRFKQKSVHFHFYE